MCGIVGIAGDLFFKEEATMQRLFLLDYFRGPDATGLAAIRNNEEVHIAKIDSDPIVLFNMVKFRTALNGNNSKVFIGHNRYKTSGSNSVVNAHPFQFGHIVGCHNGTLEYQDKAVLEEAIGETFEVDSQALLACIAKLGIKKTIELIHEGKDDKTGAWALVWYDTAKGTLNFLRNEHRPLWLAWDKGFKRLFFASNWQFIDHAAAMASVPYELEKYERKDTPGSYYRFFAVPANTHLEFDVDVIKKGSSERPKPKIQILRGKELKKEKPPITKLWDPFPKPTTVPTGTGNSTTPSRSSRDNVFHLFGDEGFPYTIALPMVRFHDLVYQNNGCSWCKADLKWGDRGITVYDKTDTVLCKKCSGYKEDAELIPAAKLYLEPERFETFQKKAA